MQAGGLWAQSGAGHECVTRQHAELRHGTVYAAGAAQPRPHDDQSGRLFFRHPQCESAVLGIVLTPTHVSCSDCLSSHVIHI